MTQKMKKLILVMIVLIGINISTVSAQEEDTFQQVINYLFIGDPHKRSNLELGGSGTYAKIYNRKDCIAGMELGSGNYRIKINWNNVDVNSIAIVEKIYVEYSLYFLSLSGGQPVVDVYVGGPELDELTSLLERMGVFPGSHTSISFSLGRTSIFNYDKARIANAIDHLYSEHCTGSEKKSAF